MKAFWVSLYTEINDNENLKKYGEQAIPVIKHHGGKPVVRGGKIKSFSGDSIIRTVIWEFPSYEKALSCHDSKEYENAWSHAKDTTKRHMFIVEGINTE